MSVEFEQLLAQFEEFQSTIHRIDDQFGDLDAMQSQVADIEATATSGDHSVSVTAGPGGAVTDIRLTPEALKQRPDALAGIVLSTLQQAVADSARQQASLVDTHMGGDGIEVTERVMQTQAQLFGTTPERLRSDMQEAAPAPSSPADDLGDDDSDDYSQRSILEPGDSPHQPSHPRTEPQQDEPGTAGEEFLRNLFNDEDEDGDHR